MNTGNEHIKVEKKKGIGIITLNSPEALNVLEIQTLQELRNSLIELEKDEQVRAIIITGGKNFCAGANIKRMKEIHPKEAETLSRLGHEVYNQVENMGKPVIAAIAGYALGGGCELALACTFRLATPQARFGLPEIKLGLIPGYGGTQRLPRLIGLPMALEILMSGRFVDAEEAVRLGLANRIVARNPLDEAVDYARQFSGYSLLTLRLVRDAAQRALSTPLADGLRIEADLSTLSMESLDGKEGTRAFLEKRKPRFQDR